MRKPVDLRKEFPTVLDKMYRHHKRYQKVTEIMSRDVVTTTPETTMAEAAKAMGEKRIGSLIVVAYHTPVGIVTERDLLSKVLTRALFDPREAKVEGIMSYPLITLCITATIKEAAQTMIKKKGRLAVFECGNLVGIITASDLIRTLPEAPETEVKVEDFMTRRIVSVDEKIPVSSAANMMGVNRIGSLIVTAKGEPTGIFTERDLLTTFLAKDKPLSNPVGDSCASPLITAPPDISVHEAAYTMTTKHVRRLPITKDGKLVGIVTARDLVEAYAK